jgi:putative membrane protein insertion efficiency factor
MHVLVKLGQLSRRGTVAVLISGIRVYQYIISPWLGPACRYQPSCSQFAIEAVERHGVMRGGWLAARRLGRCQPLGSSGYDPVP